MAIIKKFKDFFALERNIAAICLANILWTSIFLYRSYLPKFYEGLGASIFIVGLLFSLQFIFGGISCLIGGVLTDRYGRKKVWVPVSFVGLFLTLGYVIAPDWIYLIPVIIASYFLGGLEESPIVTMIMESVKKRKRATAMSSVYLSGTLPHILFIPIGGWLIDNYGTVPGMRIAVLVAFFISLLGNIVMLAYSKETLKKRIKRSVTDIKQKFVDLINLGLKIKSILSYVSLYWFIASITAAYTIFYALDVIKITAVEWGIILSIQFAIISIFIFLGGKISDKYGRRPSFLISPLISIITPIIFILSKSFYHLIVFGIFSGLGTLAYSSFYAYAADHISPSKRGRSMGILSFISYFSSIPGPIIGAFLYSISPQYPFLATSVLSFMMFLISFKFIH